jgi:hypothetical protein
LSGRSTVQFIQGKMMAPVVVNPMENIPNSMYFQVTPTQASLSGQR